jgi:hypothetical protein
VAIFCSRILHDVVKLADKINEGDSSVALMDLGTVIRNFARLQNCRITSHLRDLGNEVTFHVLPNMIAIVYISVFS